MIMMVDINGLPKNANGIRTTHTCELCGFEPKTKNKYREKQDHLVMKHFKDRIDKIFPHCRPYKCPNPDCDFTGKDKQALLRHYTGKHGVLELYLREALAEKGIQYNISDSAKRKNMNQSERKAKEARLSPPTQITNIHVSPVTNLNTNSTTLTIPQTVLTPTVIKSTGAPTYPTINATLANNQQLNQHQTMVADTTTPFGSDLSEIVYTSTVTRLPILHTTKIPASMSISSPVTKFQTTMPITRLPTMPITKLPTLTSAKLPAQPVTKLPTVPTNRLPPMSSVLTRPFTNYGRCDVDALLASFQPIDGQLIVNLPNFSDLPLDSDLVSSTTPDFILPEESTKLVLNDNIMWGGGNLPVIEPAQTVPVNYLDAGCDLNSFDDLDYEYLTAAANSVNSECNSILAGANGERQLSFSMM